MFSLKPPRYIPTLPCATSIRYDKEPTKDATSSSGGFCFADCRRDAAINRSTSETAHCIEVVRNSATIRTALRTIHTRDGCF
jgi:hypothetical protein